MAPEWMATTGALAGLAVGGAFYGGLWLAVAALPRARHPAVLVLGSFVVRALLVLGVLWWLASVSAVALAAGCAGLLVSRLVTLCMTRPEGAEGRQCT
ncbi:MAG: ATP synthase subunit I [Gammaproteobacteria bacterium]